MKLVTIDGREVAGRPGIILDGGDVLDLTAAPSTLSESQWIPFSVVSILAAGDAGHDNVRKLTDALAALSDDETQALKDQGVLTPVAQARLMCPLRRPGLMLISLSDAGGSTRNRVYIKSPNAAAGNGAVVDVPKRDGTVVAKPLLAAVIGKPLHNATEAEAAEAIAAYTVLIEFETAEQDADTGAGWRQYVESKQLPESCPMGPAMVTVDEINDPAHLQVKASVNGVEAKQGALLDSSIDPARTVAELSARYGFSTGDLVAFSLRGNSPLDTQLQPGDNFSVDLPGIMTLSCSVSI